MFNFIDSNMIDEVLNRRSASSDRPMSDAGAGIVLAPTGGIHLGRIFSSEVGQSSGGIACEALDKKKRSGSLVSSISIRTDGEAELSMEVSPECRPAESSTAPKGVIGAFSSAPAKGSVICTLATTGALNASRRGSDCSTEGAPSATSGSLIRYPHPVFVTLCSVSFSFRSWYLSFPVYLRTSSSLLSGSIL